MDFEQLVGRRRMVRNYADVPIERAVLERIARLAQRAPSAGFSQGVRLVLVTEPETKRQIAELCDEAEYVAAGFDPWLSRAAALFVPCVSEEVYRARYREPDKRRPGEPEMDWPVPYWWLDLGGNVMLLLLAAVNEGLAAGFLGTHRTAELQALLGIPADFLPAGVITVGQPAADRRSGSLARGWLPFEQFCRWESW